MSYRLLLIKDHADSGHTETFDLMVVDGVEPPINALELCVELRRCIEALLRRVDGTKQQEIASFGFGGMIVNFRKSEIMRNESRVELSERESRLLQYFVENRGKILSRTTLLQQVWGLHRAPLTRTVDVHVLRLRQKIENDPKSPRFIITVHGLGYRFDG